MDRGAWWATVHGVTESDLTEWLTHTFLSGILLCSCIAVCLSIHSRWTFFSLWGQLRIKPLQTSEYRFLCGHMLSFHFGKWASPVAQQVQCRRHGFDPWVGKISRRSKWHPTPRFLFEEPHGQRSLAGCSPWVQRVGHNCARMCVFLDHTVSLCLIF